MNNVAEFTPVKTAKLIEDCLSEMAALVESLLDNGVDLTSVVGVLEITKHQIITEAFEYVEE